MNSDVRRWAWIPHGGDFRKRKRYVPNLTTIRKKALSHREKLDALKAQVQCLRRQLRKAHCLASMGTMTAMVAHEFNNILTPIISYAQMAQTNPALVAKAIARAADGGKRAAAICNAIMSLTRCSQSAKERADLRELIDETLAAMARDPKKDGIDLKLDAPAGLTVNTRRVELQQVLLNLILNARHAVMAKPGPRSIQVKAEGSDGKVVIRVADNGVGIAPQNFKRIFEPFYTTRGGNGNGAGHGLGLTICKDIVKSLGGRITVRSAVGQGATFTVALPA
ncbi:MAG: sensor histidine kinase [Phycisphaerae bacterium]